MLGLLSYVCVGSMLARSVAFDSLLPQLSFACWHGKGQVASSSLLSSRRAAVALSTSDLLRSSPMPWSHAGSVMCFVPLSEGPKKISGSKTSKKRLTKTPTFERSQATLRSFHSSNDNVSPTNDPSEPVKSLVPDGSHDASTAPATDGGQGLPSNCSETEETQLPAALDDLKVSELKELLRARGLAVSGKKAELLARLTGQEAKGSEGSKPKRRRRQGPTRAREEELWSEGYDKVAGVDEVGRGPLAGPVVAAAVILPREGVDGEALEYLDQLDDSKKLSERQREEVFEKLTQDPRVVWAVEFKSNRDIDAGNILACAEAAMVSAVSKLSQQPSFILVDGNRVPKALKVPAEPIVKGDGLCCNIAAASIIAKVTRDRFMNDAHEKWPEYNFLKNKGYGTQEHMEAINKSGPCPLHRLSFAPLKPSGS